MADFTFYHNPMSRSCIAHWALQEVSAGFDVVPVEWGAMPQALLDANPMGKIPTLVHHHTNLLGDSHDHVITEAPAICHYLAEVYPDAGLLPDSHEKASYFRWLFFAAGPLEAAVMAKSMGWEVADDKRAMAGFGTYELAVDTLDNWLKEHLFVCGDRFTMADVYVGSQVDWGLIFQSLPDRPSFKAYQARLNQRPAKKAREAADIKLRDKMAATAEV